MFAFHHSRAAFNSLILLLGSEHAFGQSPRLEPACHEERLAMDSIKAEILAYQLGATSEVPGSEIMAVSYWGAHWRKHETSEIYRTAKYRWPLGQVYAIRKRVEIHFMGRGDALRITLVLTFRARVSGPCCFRALSPDAPAWNARTRCR